MNQLLLPLFLLISLMTGCHRQENLPVAAHSGGSGNSHTAKNTLTFASTDWTFEVNEGSNPLHLNTYQSTLQVSSPPAGLSLPVSATGLTGVSSRSASYSLSMAASAIRDTASFCYWYSPLVLPATLRVGSSLTLKAKIRVSRVEGQGVTLMIRDDKHHAASLLCETRTGQATITGTADFTDYTFTLLCTNTSRYFRVYLLMRPQTTGTVTFSDVSIQVS